MAEKLADELKAIEISEAPPLSDWPVDVIHMIVGKLDLINRFVLRKVCRKLRDFIDKKDPGIKEIYVDINAFASSSMLVDCKTISYTDRDEGCTVKLYNRSEKYIEKTALNAMKDDLAVIMKNPKLRLDKFSVSAYGNSKKVVEWLEEYHNSQNIYKTKRIKMEYLESSDVISMLSYFKPRVLEEIGIRCLANFTNISEVSNLFELEQWKKAKSLTMSSMEHFNFPIEHLFHFSKFTVFWTKCSVDDAIKFRDIIMKSPHFKAGLILADDEIEPEVVRLFDPSYIGNDNIDMHEFIIDGFNVQILGCAQLLIEKI